MKKQNSFILFICLLFGMSLPVSAQIIDLNAGSGLVELHAGNYQYGFVQWQMSSDTIHFEDIEGAIDTVYRFQPTENGYYRAKATFSNCAPVFTPICHVILPPKANGGPSRVLSEGDGAMLYGLLPKDCTGEWKIIQGKNGHLEHPDQPECYFIGTDSEYKLTWTVTNACGSDSDTISIRYVHTEINPNYAVVDTTDVILSDSTQLLNGLYVIRFSDPVPQIMDSTVLIGIGDHGFMRKVTHCESLGANTFSIQTMEATLSDLITEGVLSIDYSDIDVSSNKHQIIYRYPTRKELMSEECRSGKYVFMHRDKDNKGQVELDPEGFFTFDFGPIALSSDGLPATAIPNATPLLKLRRNFVLDWEHHGLHVDEFRFGFYNAQLMRELYFQMAAVNVTIPFIKKQIHLPHYFNTYFTFIFMGAPVCIYIVPSIYFSLSGTFQLTADYTYYQRETTYFTRAIEYRDHNWTKLSFEEEEKYTESTEQDGGFDIDFYIGPRLDFNPYEIIKGPYLTLGPYIKYKYHSIPNDAIRHEGGARFTIGIDHKFFGLKLDFSATLNAPVSMYESPRSIQAWSGNHQHFISGQTLPNPISVQVLDSKNKPVKPMFLHLEALDGEISDDFLLTDENGIAQTNWTPVANSNGVANLKFPLYDVDGAPIKGSPVTFAAYQQGVLDLCQDSDLTLRVTKENGLLHVDVNGGNPPYVYSEDGIHYTDTPPVIAPYTNELYTIYVKDSDGCIEEQDFVDPPINCHVNPVHIEVTQVGNSITIGATGGEPPYKYSMDGTYYTGTDTYNNLPNGDYTCYVMDSNTCGDEMQITINTEDDDLKVSTLPAEITDNGYVILQGEAQASGGTVIKEEGFCISRYHQPSFYDHRIVCSATAPQFSVTVFDGFSQHVTYYIRAYAVGTNGVSWGDEVALTYEHTFVVSGYVNGLYSVAEGQQVLFSQGNLQYISNADGTYWRFADHQWDYLGNNGQGSSSAYVNRDLFGWGTSGINHGAVCYQPWSIQNQDFYYYAYGNVSYNLYDQSGQADWGYNAISNGGNMQQIWRTLSQAEWDYLFHTRYTRGGIRFAKAKVNGVNGVVLVPDNWDGTVYTFNRPDEVDVSFGYNVLDGDLWNQLESYGVVFLPTSGYRDYTTVTWQNSGAYYWSSQHKDSNTAYCLRFADLCVFTDDYNERRLGAAVRLVYEGEETAMLPEVNTFEVSDVTMNSAMGHGKVVNAGGSAVIERGVCWNNSGHPTLFDTHQTQGSGTGSFSVEITGLTPDMTYYVRAYAINQAGVSYGPEVVFTTYSVTAPVGAIAGLFSVNDANRQVFFSKGNLQYIGSASTPYWKFAEHQWDYFGNNGQGTTAQNVDRDLFAWGTSGYNHGAVNYQPWQHGPDNHNYNAYGNEEYNLNDGNGQADWGYNAIANGGNQNGIWRTLTIPEWYYLLFTRNTASGIRYVKAKVNNINGVIVFPDNWNPSNYTFNYTNSTSASFGANVVSDSDWLSLESHGAVFLPAAGYWSDNVSGVGSEGVYWSATKDYSTSAYIIDFYNSSLLYTDSYRGRGFSVRLAQNYLTTDVSVITNGVNDIQIYSAVAEGTAICDIESVILEKGICWSTSADPTIDGSHVSCGAGTGSFTVNLTNLTPNTTYHVRAYAVNDQGAIYGEDIAFTTLKYWQNGYLPGRFSLSATQIAQFSQGNLSYQASTNTWRFHDNQFDYCGYGNQNISAVYEGWIDLFGWGTSGNDHGAVCYQPWSNSQSNGNYNAYGNVNYNLYDMTGEADWGHNRIVNGGQDVSLWHTMSVEEFQYLLFDRPTVTNMRFAYANVCGTNGLLILPDDWDPSICYLGDVNNTLGSYGTNTFDATRWDVLESNGVVFIPAAGYRVYGNSIGVVGTAGWYWTATQYGYNYAYRLNFGSNENSNSTYQRSNGYSVRLAGYCSLIAHGLEVKTVGKVNCCWNAAKVGGMVIHNDSSAVTQKGICYSTGSNPTIANQCANAGPGNGSFVQLIEGLAPNTTYHLRAFAVTGGGVVYGEEVSFTTDAAPNLPEGVVNGQFSIAEDRKVYFSQGNLQYQASTNTWRFATHQWDWVGYMDNYGNYYGTMYGNSNNSVSSTYEGWIDLFGWGTSGYNHGAISYQPWSTDTHNDQYYAYGSYNNNLFDYSGKADWGYNPISDGGNQENQWRTLTYSEWYYLIYERNCPYRFAFATVNDVKGVILLPDNWSASIYGLSKPNDYSNGKYADNIISELDWYTLEWHGAVFLPAAGTRSGGYCSMYSDGSYWGSTYSESGTAHSLTMGNYGLYVSNNQRYKGSSVRLVQTAGQ